MHPNHAHVWVKSNTSHAKGEAIRVGMDDLPSGSWCFWHGSFNNNTSCQLRAINHALKHSRYSRTLAGRTVCCLLVPWTERTAEPPQCITPQNTTSGCYLPKWVPGYSWVVHHKQVRFSHGLGWAAKPKPANAKASIIKHTLAIHKSWSPFMYCAGIAKKHVYTLATVQQSLVGQNYELWPPPSDPWSWLIVFSHFVENKTGWWMLSPMIKNYKLIYAYNHY